MNKNKNCSESRWNKIISHWLVCTGEFVKTADGKDVQILELNYEDNDEFLSIWATHFRNHYCLDEQIDELRLGTNLSRKEYLSQIKFPDASSPPGPSIRAGDFAEILVADYLEFILGFWVPRTRYIDKAVRNESIKGSDTIGFKFEKTNKFSPNDTLVIAESKAKYTGNDSGKMQEAIDHSAKDTLRKAESLNAIKQRFLNNKQPDKVSQIARFQNEVDNPYKQKYGAVAHLDNSNFDYSVIASSNCSGHPLKDQLFLLVIKGEQMMTLVHSLYKRGMDEA